MKANKIFFWGGLALILALTVVLADNPHPVDPKDKELDELLKQSQSRMSKVNSLVKRIDQVASTEVTTMKESIEVLQEEKIALTAEKADLIEEKQKLTHVLYETKAVLLSRDSSIPAPFKLEPILPLSEDWGWGHGGSHEKEPGRRSKFGFQKQSIYHWFFKIQKSSVDQPCAEIWFRLEGIHKNEYHLG